MPGPGLRGSSSSASTGTESPRSWESSPDGPRSTDLSGLCRRIASAADDPDSAFSMPGLSDDDDRRSPRGPALRAVCDIRRRRCLRFVGVSSRRASHRDRARVDFAARVGLSRLVSASPLGRRRTPTRRYLQGTCSCTSSSLCRVGRPADRGDESRRTPPSCLEAGLLAARRVGSCRVDDGNRQADPGENEPTICEDAPRSSACMLESYTAIRRCDHVDESVT